MNEDFDSADLDALKELERSPGQALVVKRLNHELERKRAELEKVQMTEAETACARGYINALRMMLGLPQILMDEEKRK